MKIKAETTYNFENIKRHYFFETFHGNLIGAILFYAIVAFIAVLSIVNIIATGANIFWLAILGASLYYGISTTIRPWLQNNNRGVMYNIKNIFYFAENSFTFESENSVYSGKSKVKYGDIYMVYETPKCFYFYLSKKTMRKEAKVVMIEKSGFFAGTPEQLEQLLRKALPAKRYCVRKLWIF